MYNTSVSFQQRGIIIEVMMHLLHIIHALLRQPSPRVCLFCYERNWICVPRVHLSADKLLCLQICLKQNLLFAGVESKVLYGSNLLPF
jgi:hypothetical protein